MEPRSVPPPLSARERILKTAHDLFYREGVHSTGINRIIDEARVTKVTFYRHFPSKHDLIRAYLVYRHECWMKWFNESLARHGNTIRSLGPVLEEWFCDPEFRGCAFLNSVSELEIEFPDVLEMTRQHKAEVESVIKSLLPSHQSGLATVISIAVDGATVKAQYDVKPEAALNGVNLLIEKVLKVQ